MTGNWLRRKDKHDAGNAARGRRPAAPSRRWFRPRVEELESRILLDSGLNRAFVTQVYRDLLGRDADPAGLAGWAGALDAGWLTRSLVVLGVEGSLEYRARQVEDLYATLLHRPADPLGLAGFVTFLGQGGTAERAAALLLGSAEYRQNRGGGSDAGFLAALYADVLGRPLDPGGLNAWGPAMAVFSPTAVASMVLHSPEAQAHQVQAYYQRFLHRAPDPAGMQAFVSFLQQGVHLDLSKSQFLGSSSNDPTDPVVCTTDNLEVICALVASPEYLGRADTEPPVVTILSPGPGLVTNHNVTVTGRVTDAGSGVASLQGQVFSQPTPPVDVPFDPAGNFILTTHLALDGSDDGSHQVTFRAADRAGNVGPPVTLTFTLDIRPPAVDFHLAAASDTPPVGDGHTQQLTVTLEGTAEPNTAVVLQQTGAAATADPVTGAFSFAGVPLVLGDNPFTVTATDHAGNVGTAAHTITRDRTGVALTEATNFLTTFHKTFTVPAQASHLEFTYDTLNFDTRANFIKDAFEAALLGADGNPLVLPITGARDAFLNVTEGRPPVFGPNVQVHDGTVDVDLTHVAAGTQATLEVRLVNNDSDTTTTVHIDNVAVLPGGLNTPVAVTPAIAAARAGGSTLDLSALADVTASMTADYGQTSFREDGDTLYTDLALTNAGAYPVNLPLVAVVTHLSDPSVRVLGADGATPDGAPYFDFSGQAGGQPLGPHQTTQARALAFANPDHVQFHYDLVVLGQLNRPPVITSTPVTEAIIGKTYHYAVLAADPDGDPLTYRLVSGPHGLQLDPASGQLTWAAPGAAGAGTYSVALRVSDGRGGGADQTFTLTVDAPPNRPPVITSLPVVDANVNTGYTYQVLATDPDGTRPTDPNGETLTYSVVSGPPGLSIDSTSGLVSWTPTIEQPRKLQLDNLYQGGIYPGQTHQFTVDSPPTNTIEVPAWGGANQWSVDVNNTGANTFEVVFKNTGVSGTQGSSPNLGVFSILSPTLSTIADVKLAAASLTYNDPSRLSISATSFSYDFGGLPFGPGDFLTLDVSTATSSSAKMRLQVDDGQGGTATQSYTIAVHGQDGNHPPAIVSQPVTTVIPGTAYTYAVQAIDADRDPLTYSLTTAPPGMTIDPASGLITWNGPSTGAGTVGPAPVDGLTLTAAGAAAGFSLTDFVHGFAFQNVGSGNIGPLGIVFPSTSGGNQVLVGDFADGTLRLFATDQDGQAAGSAQVVANPGNINNTALVQLGGKIYLCEYRANQVIEVNPDGSLGQTVASIPLPTGMVANPKNGHLFVSGASAIYDVDPVAHTVTPFVTGLGATPPDGLALSPDGKTLYVAISNYQRLAGFDTSTGQQVFLSGFIPSLDGIALGFGSLAGFLFANTNIGQVWEVDLNNPTNPVLIASGGSRGDFVSIDPHDGSLLVTQSDEIVRLRPPLGASFIQDFQFPVTVRVDDGRGGFDTQSFTIRPPAPAQIHGTVHVSQVTPGPFSVTAHLTADNSYALYHGQADGSGLTFVGGGNNWPVSDAYTFTMNPGEYVYAVVWDYGAVAMFLGQFDFPGGTALTNTQDWEWMLGTAPNSGSAGIPPSLAQVQSDITRNTWAAPQASAPYGTGPWGGIANISPQANFIWPDTFDSSRTIVEPTYAIFRYRSAGPAFSNTKGWTVYLDENHNGRFDPGEPTAQTDINGNYSFPNLAPGTYQVAEVPQTGWVFADPVGGNRTVTVTAGQTVSGVDFTNEQVAPGTIQGTVFNDLNANGTQDAGADPPENGLAGWTVYLDQNQNGRLDPDERSTLTRADGTYTFANLAPGSYTVREQNQDGWKQTAPAGGVQQVTVTANQVTDHVDFGNAHTGDGLPNQLPTFTTTPPTATQVGTIFRYYAAATDPDGDSLTYDLPVHPPGVAVHPTLGILTWVPTADDVGTHDFILRVTDDRGGVALQSFRLTVQGQDAAPVITSTPPGPAVAGLTYQYQVRAQDATGAPITFAVQGALGDMAIDPAGGVLTWHPTLADVGTHSFTVRAADPLGSVGSQTFNLEVVASAVNDPPAISSAPRGQVRLGTTYFYAVRATDADGDPLTYQLDTHPDGISIDSAGMITWKPTAAEFGANAVVVRVSDGRGASVVQQFTVNVVTQTANHPPVITSTPILAATVGVGYHYDLTATDADGDPLSFSLGLAPAGMSLDAGAGTLRWTPTADQLGSQGVTVRVADTQGGVATQTFTVTVRGTNLPPVISSGPVTSAAVGQAYTYAVKATDPEGGPLTYSLTAGSGDLSIDAGGTVHWHPTAGEVGRVNVVVRVTDVQGASTDQPYTVVVSAAAADQAPVITSAPVTDATVGQAYTYQVMAHDPDGDAVQFALQDFPPTMQIDRASGLITYLPPTDFVGFGPVTIVATDPAGLKAVQSFTLTIHAANQPPAISSTAPATVTGGLTYHYDVQAADPDGDPLGYHLDTAPAGMAVDDLGRITWATTAADVGLHHVQLTVTDGRGGSVRQQFDVTVAADTLAPQVMVSVSDSPVALGGTVTIVASAVDNVGVQTLNVTVGGRPVPVDSDGRATATLTTVGPVDVVATGTDAAGNVGTATATVTVFDPSVTQAPTVDLATPADGAMITAPTDVVGTVQDAHLVSWKLEVAQADGGTFTTIATGTGPVSSDVLGKFDPTMLQNDSYVLRLSAVNTGGQSASVEHTVNVSGGLKLGSFTLSFVDLSLPVNGMPVTVARTYDTMAANQNGELGFGWKLAFRDVDLRTSVQKAPANNGFYYPFRDGTHVYVTVPGGKREGFTFTPVGEGISSLLGYYRPAFTPDPGVKDTLSLPDFSLLPFDDGYYGAFTGKPYNPADPSYNAVYTLTTKAGVSYQIDGVSNQLLGVIDPNGNTVTYADDGITSSLGQKVVFERDAQGRIVSAADLAGNKVLYQYDASGDLVATTDRQGNVTHLVYSTTQPHYLENVIDPLGRTGARVEYDDQGHISKVTDGAGVASNLAFDASHSTETITDKRGNSTTFRYDDRGNVVSQTNALGGTTVRTFDADNNLLSQTDPLGRTATFTYDGNSNLLTVTDPLGNVTHWTYVSVNLPGAPSPVFLPQSITDPLGQTVTNTYDDRGNPLTTTDPLGNVVHYSFDADGRMLSKTDPRGLVTQLQYDAQGHVMASIDTANHESTFGYDANGYQTTQATTRTNADGQTVPLSESFQLDPNMHLSQVTDPTGGAVSISYDAAGQVSGVVNPANGAQVKYERDADGRTTKASYPDGTSEITVYDANGNVTSQTDRAGRTTINEYDARNRLVRTTFSDGSTRSSEYDAGGQLTAGTDRNGHRTTYEYDADGRVVKATDAAGDSTRSTYDAAGRMTSATDPNGQTTRYEYDADGNPTRTLLPDGTSHLTSYDRDGNVIGQIDQAGRTTRFVYGPHSELTTVIDALGNHTIYTYDELGDRLTQTDANGHITRWAYDDAGHVIKHTLPSGVSETYTYGPGGVLATHTDFNGQETTYTYDVNKRPLTISYPDGSQETITYTADGRQATVTDARGATTDSFDSLGRLAQVTEPDGTTLQYGHDQAGQRTSVTTPAGTTTYSFDAANRLQSVTGPDGSITHYTYDPAGNLVKTVYPDGVTETRAYDSLGRLTSLTQTGPNGVIASYQYTLNGVGNRTDVTEPGSRHVHYTYDALDRLTQEAITDPVAGNRTIDYSYDAVGNRLTRNDSVAGLTFYIYDANDRLTSETTGTDTTQYTYDNNGNLLSRVRDAVDQVFAHWDARNRLASADVTDGLGTHHLSYQYDDSGEMVSRTVDGQQTRYLVDENRLVPEVVAEYAPGGSLVASYVFGPELISQNRAGQQAYYLGDGLGSVRVLTDPAGTVTDRYTYDAFGKLLAASGTTTNAYEFAGQRYDSVLGDYYMRARYFDAGTGRFLSVDPAAPDRQNSQALDRYVYADGNPVNRVDPLGLDSEEETDLAVTAGTGYDIASINLGGLAGFLTAGSGIGNFADRVRQLGWWDAVKPDAFLMGPFSGALGLRQGVYSSVSAGGTVEMIFPYFSSEDGRSNAAAYLNFSLNFGHTFSTGGGPNSIDVHFGNVYNFKDPTDYAGPATAVNINFPVLGGAPAGFSFYSSVPGFGSTFGYNFAFSMDLDSPVGKIGPQASFGIAGAWSFAIYLSTTTFNDAMDTLRDLAGEALIRLNNFSPTDNAAGTQDLMQRFINFGPQDFSAAGMQDFFMRAFNRTFVTGSPPR